MKSKRELLRSLIGNKNVVITSSGAGTGYVIRAYGTPPPSTTSTIDEVGEDMIHAVTPKYANLQHWIAIDWIAEIQT